MKKKYWFAVFIIAAVSFCGLSSYGESNNLPESQSRIENYEYTVVIEGFDWGPAVSKVILHAGETISSVDMGDFTIHVERLSDCGEVRGNASGERTIVYAYVSDEDGNIVEEGEHITLVMAVTPNLRLANPYERFRTETCNGTYWLDYQMTITNNANGQVWNQEAGRIMPLVDEFDLSGKFTYGDVTLSYASFVPETENEKSPLFIWLHGGGEGGTDPIIPLIGNKVTNYASDEIQYFFNGAYILVPQCPTRWMDAGNGQSTRGEINDIYNESLMALIQNYVAENPGIDPNRIYVSGCSNGGYMASKLLLLHPDYFAAGLISSCSYRPANLTDEQINSIKDVPIWFIQAADDRTTIPKETGLPFYRRLIEAGAQNVHMSYYDHVVDITGFFGGENYHYPGHWSWVYLHANKCKYDLDGTPVKIDGRPVTIMEWTAAQRKQ
jgi:predicted esterase